MTLTTEQRKQLIQIYTYLEVRNVWTDEPCDNYSIHGEFELPRGWLRLFLLYCKHLREDLKKHNQLDKFKFSQIKEKYGTMRLYNLGLPDSAHQLTSIYESFSEYICEQCGDFASYQTDEYYVKSFCKNHIGTRKHFHKLSKPKQMSVIKFEKDNSYKITYSYKQLYKEYKTILSMTDEEFFNYITNI